MQEKDSIALKGAMLPDGYLAMLSDGYITSTRACEATSLPTAPSLISKCSEPLGALKMSTI